MSLALVYTQVDDDSASGEASRPSEPDGTTSERELQTVSGDATSHKHRRNGRGRNQQRRKTHSDEAPIASNALSREHRRTE